MNDKTIQMHGVKKRLTVVLIVIGLINILPLFSTVNSNALSDWITDSINDFNNGTMENITIRDNAGTINLSFKELPAELIELSPSIINDPRYYFSMTSVYGKKQIFLYGGVDQNIFSAWNDTWIYYADNNSWIKKNPAINPGHKSRQASAYIYGTDKILMFGGRTPVMGALFNDTWIYNVTTNDWSEQIIPYALRPPKRNEHAMAPVYGTDKVVLYGGWGSDGKYLEYTWIYDLSDNSWENMFPKASPKARVEHEMATIMGHDKVILLGGFNGTGYDRSVWIYDLSDNNWTKEMDLQLPYPSYYVQSIAPVNGTDKTAFIALIDNFDDELVIYDLSENDWTRKDCYKKPSFNDPRMASIFGTDEILILDTKGSHPTIFHETWKLDLKLGTYFQSGNYTSDVLNAQRRSSFLKLNWSSQVPSGASIKFQIRTSSNETNLSMKEFLGPDGSNSTYYIIPSSVIWPGHNGDIWCQYKAYFTSDDELTTPLLKNVTIVYNNWPETLLVAPADNLKLSINKPLFSWSFTDMDSSGQSAFQVLIDNESSFSDVDFDSGEQASSESSWQFPNGTSFQSLPDGTWYWKVRTRDTDGAWSEISSAWKILIDATAPISNIIMPENDFYYQTISSINGTAFEKDIGSGLKKVEIKIKRFSDNYTWSETGWTSSVNWLLTEGTDTWYYDTSAITWISGKKYNARSRATDNISNMEIPKPGIEFYIDNELPNSTIEFPLNGTYLNRLESIYGTAFDLGGSGLNNVQISIQRLNDSRYWTGTDWLSIISWLDTEGTTSWTFDAGTVPWATDQRYTVISRSEDNLGKIELSTDKVTLMYDIKAPENLFISINNGSIYTNLTEAILTLDSFDSGSGVSLMALSSDAVSWSDWVPFKIEYIIYLLPDEGEQSVYFRVQDRAGNTAEYISDDIILDQTPPEQLSIVINGDSIFANSVSVSIDIIAVDALSGLDKMCFSIDRQTWTNWEDYTNKTTFELSEPDEEKTIFLRVKDGAGNPAQTKDSIILDTTPPKFMVILINEGAETTNSTTVDLLLNAEDLNSGLKGISFSTDGKTWTEWEDYTENRIFTLQEGDGTKTIYFRAIDNAGNIANPKIGEIVLDTSMNEKNSETVSPDRTDEESIDSDSTLLLIIIIFVTILITLFILYMKRRTKRLKQNNDDEQDTDQTNELEE